SVVDVHRNDSVPVPGWRDRAVRPLAFEQARDGVELVESANLEGRRVLVLQPERDLVPGEPANGAGPYAFDQLYTGHVRCELRLWRGDEVVSATTAGIEVYDAHELGSLYQRVLDAIVRPDTQRQFRDRGVAGADPAFHPWFPVLLIGADKAALYKRALV